MALQLTIGPYTLSLEEGARTIVLTGVGQGKTADTLQLIASARDLLRAHPGYHMLYDAIRLQIDSSPQDMIAVANALFADKDLRYGKFAVAVPSARESLARIFTALANDSGVTADVFTNLAEARRWLYS